MNQIFQFIKIVFTRNNFRIFSVVLIIFLLAWDISHASETWISDENSQKLVDALNWFIAVAATLLGLITAFITLFTYPGWTNGTLFGLTEYLRDIWVLVSNVVYFIFAFILVTIAFMNIIWKWEGNWELKQALPRFIVWVLIVPFTWFLVQFILSISAVLTVAVLSLPYDIFRDKLQDDTNSSELLNQGICVDIIINLQSGEATEGVSLTDSDDGLMEAIRCRNEDSKVSIMDIVTWEEWWQWVKNSMFWIISVYTYGILRVQELSKVNVWDIAFYKELIDLILKIFFDIFFIAVYLLLMVALMLALFTRWIKLWIFIMLSPVFWLMYFFGKSKEWFWEQGKNYNVKEFISLAMIPVYVSAALAFWFVFILVATEWLKEHVSDGSSLDQLDLWWFQLEVKWSYGDWELNLWVIGKLIVQIFWVAILWIAVMAALRSSEATKAIVEPIYQFWQSMWQLAAKAPTYAPIIPTPDGKGMSAASLATVWWSLKQSAEAAQTSRWSSFVKDTFPSLSWGIDLTQKSTDAIGMITNRWLRDRSTWDAFSSAMKEWKNVADLSWNSQFIQLTNKMLEELGESNIKAQKWDQNSILNALRRIDELSESNQQYRTFTWDDWILPGIWDSRQWDMNRLNTYLSWWAASIQQNPQTPAWTWTSPWANSTWVTSEVINNRVTINNNWQDLSVSNIWVPTQGEINSIRESWIGRDILLTAKPNNIQNEEWTTFVDTVLPDTNGN